MVIWLTLSGISLLECQRGLWMPQSNYAMEEYGEGSMCFEQAGPWEQKSCKQLRLWQKYGGGKKIFHIDSR